MKHSKVLVICSFILLAVVSVETTILVMHKMEANSKAEQQHIEEERQRIVSEVARQSEPEIVERIEPTTSSEVFIPEEVPDDPSKGYDTVNGGPGYGDVEGHYDYIPTRDNVFLVNCENIHEDEVNLIFDTALRFLKDYEPQDDGTYTLWLSDWYHGYYQVELMNSGVYFDIYPDGNYVVTRTD